MNWPRWQVLDACDRPLFERRGWCPSWLYRCAEGTIFFPFCVRDCLKPPGPVESLLWFLVGPAK